MIRVRFARAAQLQGLVEAVADAVTSECNFSFGAEGITLDAMDASHVSLCALHLRAEGVKEYLCEVPRVVGLSVNTLNAILKRVDADAEAALVVPRDGTSVFLGAGNAQAGKFVEFELNTMNIDEDPMVVPAMNSEYIVRMSSAELAQTVHTLTALKCDVCEFRVETAAAAGAEAAAEAEAAEAAAEAEAGATHLEKRARVDSASAPASAQTFCMRTRHDTIGNIEFRYEPRAEKTKTTGTGLKARVVIEEYACAIACKVAETDKPRVHRFAVRYLEAFMKAAPLSDYVRLCFGREVGTKANQPLLVEFLLSHPDTGAAGEAGHIRFYLAPKMEDNE